MYCTGLMCCELFRQNSQSTLLKIETPAAKKNAKPVANIFLNGANIHLNIKMFWLNYLSYILRAASCKSQQEKIIQQEKITFYMKRP